MLCVAMSSDVVSSNAMSSYVIVLLPSFLPPFFFSILLSLSFLLLLSRLSPLPYSTTTTYAYAPSLLHLPPYILTLHLHALSIDYHPPAPLTPLPYYCLHPDHYRKTEQHQPERDHRYPYYYL
jgi:hypothetical protein